MNVQVLVAAMNQTDHNLLKKMNIQSNVIVGNQCEKNEVEKFDFENYEAVYLNFCERGVGLNRNNALMRATSEFCLFADDDMVYDDGYPEIVRRAFELLPKADVIIFNLRGRDKGRGKINKIYKVNYMNYLKFGTARIAIRREVIKKNGIFFNQCFGGGTEHCHGEDNLFLTECLKKRLKVYAFPEYIASLTEERESTWNCGCDEKFFMDQGVLYYYISHKLCYILCLQDAIRHKSEYGINFFRTFSMMRRGIKKELIRKKDTI